VRLNRISDLRCPRAEATQLIGVCGGVLGVPDRTIPILRNGNDEDDVLEGLLRCYVCSTQYTVIRGVLLLLPDVDTSWLTCPRSKFEYDAGFPLSANANCAVSELFHSLTHT